jgi:hypothetical protein
MFNLNSVLKNFLVATAGVVVAVATTSCSGSQTLRFQGTRPGTLSAIRGAGQLMTSTSVSLPVYSTSSAQVGTLTLTDVRVALKEIKIKSSTRTSGDEAVRYQGPYVVNLLTDSVTPSLPEVNLAAGTYDQIEMKLDKIEGDEVDASGNQLVAETDALFGNSVYVAGTYTGTTASGAVTNMPFSFSYDLDETFELTAASDSSEGFAIGENAAASIIVAFRFRKWFAFDNASINNNGYEFANVVVQSSAITLDKDSGGINAQLRQVVRDLIKTSADYGKDNDGDSVLDETEDDDPASEDEDDN